MSALGERPAGDKVAGLEPWPYCAPVGGMCVAYEVEQYLGETVGLVILNFILTAGGGARLILQKNKDTFSVQVTEAIQRADQKPVGLAEVRALRERLDMGNDGRNKTRTA